MHTYLRTFILNLLFIIFVPLFFAEFTQSNWILVFYVPVYAFLEVMFDYFHKDIDLEALDIWKNVFIQGAWNTIMLFLVGYSFGLINAVTLSLSALQYGAILSIVAIIIIALFSYLELQIDNKIYKDRRVYVKRH